MEQIKEKIKQINPVEWEATHLDAHKHINSAITQFYWLFDEVVNEFNSLAKIYEDAEEKNSTSFSKLREEIGILKECIQLLTQNILDLNEKLNEKRKFLTRNYEWIVDTDRETTIDLEPITDEDLKGKTYLANIVVNESLPNQWAIAYSFPNTSIVQWEYTPRVYLKAKEWEHAVLEYDFTIILTEI